MKYFFYAFILLLASCSTNFKITNEHVQKNEVLIKDVSQYMKKENIDTLIRKKADKIVKKKLRKLKIHKVIREYNIKFYSNEELKQMILTDTIFEFKRFGPILGYNETIQLIKKNTDQNYLKMLIQNGFSNVNDTILINRVYALPLM